MARIIVLENDTEATLVKNALQQYVDYVNKSEDQTDLDGTLISLARDLPPIEAVISSIEHSSDQPVDEVLYSKLSLEYSPDEIAELLQRKINDDTVILEILSDDKIEEYYFNNIKINTPEVE